MSTDDEQGKENSGSTQSPFDPYWQLLQDPAYQEIKMLQKLLQQMAEDSAAGIQDADAQDAETLPEGGSEAGGELEGLGRLTPGTELDVKFEQLWQELSAYMGLRERVSLLQNFENRPGALAAEVRQQLKMSKIRLERLHEQRPKGPRPK